MNFFDKLNDTIQNTENSVVNVISTVAPWLSPLAPAYMTYQHAINPETLKFPNYIALPVAMVVEILGFSAVSTFMSFWFYNRRNRAENKKAPLTLIIVAFGFYLGLILFSNVLLDAFGNENWTITTVRALYTLQTIPAALIVAVRTQHRDMLSEITKEKQEKELNKPQTTQSNQPQIITPQNKLSKIETAYLFVSNYYSKNKSLPTNQVVSDNAGVSIGSAYKALASFIVKNEDQLVSGGNVTQEQVIKAHSVLGQTMKQEANASDVISEFINSNGRFPNQDDMKQIGVSFDDAIEFVVSNQDMIRNGKLLEEDIIQQAIEKYKENQ